MTAGGGDGVFEPTAFAADFQHFLSEFGRLLPSDTETFRTRAETHLGVNPLELPSLTQKLESTALPNLQLALDDMADDRWDLVGLPGELRHFNAISLHSLMSGFAFGSSARVSAVEYVSMPISADATHPCVQLGMYFAFLDDTPVVVLVALVESGLPSLTLEVLAAERDTADRFLTLVRRKMEELNVYRGKVLIFGVNDFGRPGVNFHVLPTVTRDDIVLPAADIDAIERHTLGIAQRAEALRRAGRHLKRGLLLYGPPGTGKTLSVMYLCNLMPERTTLILSGIGGGAVAQAASIARSLQPSMVVVEDVDLVAMERTMPGATTNPLLFQLLNEMDGMAADADVIFVLTTNRAELLEPALAARPGRVDEVVEVKLPDAEQRMRLFELYLRGVDHRLQNLANAVSATEGVSAAFIKELIRRAVVSATEPGAEAPGPVLDEHLTHSLADIISRSDPLTRSVLGGANRPTAE